ncbi:MAG TPA: hypothetical protein ENH38_00610 [Nitrospirae bacterium]|nr:hypothetical protein [Nitrospirota bacterium]
MAEDRDIDNNDPDNRDEGLDNTRDFCPCLEKAVDFRCTARWNTPYIPSSYEIRKYCFSINYPFCPNY